MFLNLRPLVNSKKTVLNIIVINVCELEVLPRVCVFSCVYVHHAHLIDVSKLRAASDTARNDL